MLVGIALQSSNQEFKYALNCLNSGLREKCLDNYPSVFELDELSTETCPDYFQWIHHDLQH
ncbi:hypothetical protein SCA6_018129 [Theobroma cacao]